MNQDSGIKHILNVLHAPHDPGFWLMRSSSWIVWLELRAVSVCPCVSTISCADNLHFDRVHHAVTSARASQKTKSMSLLSHIALSLIVPLQTAAPSPSFSTAMCLCRNPSPHHAFTEYAFADGFLPPLRSLNLTQMYSLSQLCFTAVCQLQMT